VNLKLAVIILTSIAIVGCAPKKKKPADTSPMPAAGKALDVPSTPTAPAASYTPPPAPQPVVYDTPQQREQPVIQDAVVDASDSPPAITTPHAAAARYTPPARQVAQKSPAKRSNSGQKYTIKKGESLWSIAEDKYGDGNKWKKIAAANPKVNPDRVMVGQTIVLP
jgi:5'-nucleotidase